MQLVIGSVHSGHFMDCSEILCWVVPRSRCFHNCSGVVFTANYTLDSAGGGLFMSCWAYDPWQQRKQETTRVEIRRRAHS